MNPDPLLHRISVALRHSPTFVLCMTGSTLLIVAACLLFATDTLWSVLLGLALLVVAEALLWYGWRKGAI